ncbi:hypothetical protein Lfu02_05710 [Longispora fulva]|uniref:Uncharacterized protein (DUF885 family) n=1 Tax=Longispora fulva TaxID=619741 RepID=A0A8J7GFG1_9ACTN|nr:DUF885 domain-containing protein [Longispora fulva]MBG6135562.1 uncharacterized protein (DUF885 family) [Longispora fulva]GIG56199.1 hypothetical protein Lfu02_05710 [Longispora fulva]
MELQNLADEVWDGILARDPWAAERAGREVTVLPDGGPEAVHRQAGAAAVLLDRLDRLAVPDADRLTAGYLRDHLEHEVAETERFWYRFPVTPYNAMVLGDQRATMTGVDLGAPDGPERLRSLLDSHIGAVEQIRATLAEQRARGVHLPGSAVGAALESMRGHATAAAALPGPAPALARLGAAFDALIADMTAHAAAGPAEGGMHHYPGGAECYAGLIRLHTGLDLTAEHIHRIGLSEVDRLTSRIRDELGIVDEAAHRARLNADPATFAADPAELERRLRSHLDRVTPMLAGQFARLPAAPFRLTRLDPSLEAGLTWGYYDVPGADGCGYYHYNGSDLPNRPLVQAASLILHEGLPGHHLQIGRQLENDRLHPVRREFSTQRTFSIAGYCEGWAEYAAGLGYEWGLYEDPVDRYGRLCAERFHAARLVVDTGLNALGWTFERAGNFLRGTGFLSEVEIRTELVRYAVDDPGQALAYHLGHWYLRELRGTGDALTFHEAVLDEGPLPLWLLGEHLARQVP